MLKNNKVDKVVKKHLLKNVKKNLIINITDTAYLREDLSLDSLRLVSLFSSSINDLKISITDFSDTELLNISTVGDLKLLLTIKVSTS